MSRLRAPLLALSAGIVLVLASHSPSHAHGLASDGLAAGLSHPLLGLDHLLMLVAAGTAAALVCPWLLAWALGGGLVGAVLGSLGWGMPGTEALAALAITAAAASALKLSRLPQVCGLVLAASMAIHGLLHGLEAPSSAAGLQWWGGALISTLLVCGGSWLLLRTAAQQTRQALALGLGATGLLLALAPVGLLSAG